MQPHPSVTPPAHVVSTEQPAAFYTGVALFNAGAYWHAHEAWEACWHAAGEPERTLYKGLIQTAAALEQLRRGNARGLWRNWYKARPRLVATRDLLIPINLRALIHAMDRHVVAGMPTPIIVQPV